MFRRASGLRSSDELRKPGYPETPWRWPTLLVFREGVAVGRIGAPETGRGWELLVDACRAVGSAGHDPLTKSSRPGGTNNGSNPVSTPLGCLETSSTGVSGRRSAFGPPCCHW